VSAPFGLRAEEVRETALLVDILDDEGAPTGLSFYAMHPVLCMESRVHNVAGLPDAYDNEQGLRQLRASILVAREFVRDVLAGELGVEDPVRDALKLNERIFRFALRDRHAKAVFQTKGLDPATRDPR
jgi:hypothetical protein